MDHVVLCIDIDDQPIDDPCVPAFLMCIRESFSTSFSHRQFCWLTVYGLSTAEPRGYVATERPNYGPFYTLLSMPA